MPAYSTDALEELLADLPIPTLLDADVEVPWSRWLSSQLVQDQCCLVIQSLYKFCLDNDVLADSWSEAYVILLPKLGKDSLDCFSYRPITLLNQDLKILTTILPARLSQVITALVDIDQTGFIPGKSTDTNLPRLLDPFTDCPCHVFDAVHWYYMASVLRHLGFGP